MDRQIREGARPTGEDSIEQKARRLGDLMRAGEITQEKVAFLAFLGHEPAKHIAENESFPSPMSSPNGEITAYGNNDFFDSIVSMYGRGAYLSMMNQLLKVYKDLCFHVSHESIDVAINEFDQILLTNEVDKSLLGKIEDFINEEKNNQELNQYQAPIYRAALDLCSVLKGELEQTSEPYDGVLLSLLTEYPDQEFVDTLPLGMKDIISSLPEPAADSPDEDPNYYITAQNLLLGTMKQGGLKWALKDVKN